MKFSPSWKLSFWILAGFLLVFMPIWSLGFGIIWDEWIQSQYGKLVLRYFLTGGQDKSVLTFGESMYLYGGLFDTATAFVYGIFFDSLSHVAYSSLLQDATRTGWYETRHVINALCGFLAVFFAGKLAVRLAGWRAGVITMIALVLSPRFLGNAMNNPKDIPFAAAYIAALYFMACFFTDFPKPRRFTIAGLILSIAAAINIKVGGIMLIAYLWLFAVLLSFRQPAKAGWRNLRGLTPEISRLRLEMTRLIFISILAYLGGLIFWPYGQMNPIANPLSAFQAFAKFEGAQGQLLFEGAMVAHGQTPWYYLPKWILISSPLFLISGIFLFMVTAKFLFRTFSRRILFILLFATFFPPAYATLKHSVVYDSWRHFLFIYPPLIILCVVAWDYLLRTFSSRLTLTLTSVILALHLFQPLPWILKNHPNEYVYFNPLVGGLDGAYGKYETDYWGNCLRQASLWFAKWYPTENLQMPARLQADGEMISSAYYLVKLLGPLYVPVLKQDPNWDYALRLSRGVTPDHLQDGSWPPPGTLFTVKADDTPLCAVVKNTATK